MFYRILIRLLKAYLFALLFIAGAFLSLYAAALLL